MKYFWLSIMFFYLSWISCCKATNFKDLTSWQYYDQEIPIQSTEGELWVFDDNRIKCDWFPDIEEFNCNLFFLKSNKKFDFSIPLGSFIDSTSFNGYLYKSSANNLFNVFLIEGESERGTVGYYVLIFDNGRAGIYSFDQAKQLLQDNATDNKELPELNIDNAENFDEIYINPKYFISIYRKNNKFLFKIARNYMWNPDDIPITDENKYIYIEKTINE